MRRMAAAPYPAYGSCDLPLMYSPRWLKLPVLVATGRPLCTPCAAELLQHFNNIVIFRRSAAQRFIKIVLRHGIT